MTPTEKAAELVEKFKPFVSGYVGSSFMTGTEYQDQILCQAKQCALISTEYIVNSYPSHIEYWMQVYSQINLIES